MTKMFFVMARGKTIATHDTAAVQGCASRRWRLFDMLLLYCSLFPYLGEMSVTWHRPDAVASADRETEVGDRPVSISRCDAAAEAWLPATGYKEWLFDDKT